MNDTVFDVKATPAEMQWFKDNLVRTEPWPTDPGLVRCVYRRGERSGWFSPGKPLTFDHLRPAPLRHCFVMQGEPGSGKTTLAERLASAYDAIVCSTDDFHLDADGVYRFKRRRLGEFHAANVAYATYLMVRGLNVVIDNTNVFPWEARPYVAAALSHGYVVQFVRACGRFPNVHGVPEGAVERMRSNLVDLTLENVLASKAPWEEAPNAQVQ